MKFCVEIKEKLWNFKIRNFWRYIYLLVLVSKFKKNLILFLNKWLTNDLQIVIKYYDDIVLALMRETRFNQLELHFDGCIFVRVTSSA